MASFDKITEDVVDENKVSIIIPSWNRADTINRAIYSCINQTTSIYEIIVIDDGSIDNTKKQVLSLMAEYPNIKYFYQENKGAQAARNYGLSLAIGNYIGFLDADDEYLPSKVELQIAEFRRSGADIVSCFMKRVFSDGKEVVYKWNTDEKVLPNLLHYQIYIDTNSALFKRSCFDKVKFDEYCPSSQEWDLHITMAQYFKYSCVPEVLSIYHMKDSISNKYRSNDAQFNGLFYVLKKHKRIWLKTVGSGEYYLLAKKLLVNRAIYSNSALLNILRLKDIDYRFVLYIMSPIVWFQMSKLCLEKIKK